MDQAYRISTRYTELKNVSRDIIVPFVKKGTRDHVLQHFSTEIGINNSEVIVLKDISISIVQK